MLPLSRNNDAAGLQQALTAKYAPAMQATTADLDKAFAAEKQQAADRDTTSHASYTSSRTTIIVGLLLGGLMALGLGWFVARSIAGSVKKVQTVAQGLAQGDLTRSSGLRTRDELGRMGAALDTAVGELRRLLSTVVSSADAVAASSEELSASSAQISASAEETSAQSGVVSGAAEEVSRSVQTVAAGAEQMGASIREIASNAAEASEVAARAVTAAG